METKDNRTADSTAEAQGFTVTRVFDAPLDLVWKTQSEPEHLTQWWGPKGFVMQIAKMDFRPGGTFHYGMKSPEGFTMWGKLTYLDIVPQQKIVNIVSFSDENGGVTRHPMSATWPLETLGVATFAEKDGKTTLTLQLSAYNATEEERNTFNAGHASMQQGFKGTWDQLSEYLAQVQK